MLNFLVDNKFRDYFDKNEDLGIGIVDSNGKIIYYSNYLGLIENYHSSEVVNKHIFEMFPSVNYGNSTIFHCLNNNVPVHSQVQKYYNNKNDEIFAVVTNILIKDNNSNHGVIEIVHDLKTIKKKYLKFGQSSNIAKKNELNSYHSYYTFKDFVTRNPELLKMVEKLERISQHNTNVLIVGETGTGKEIIAQSIHNANFYNTPFIAENCAAIPENLMESILFGTEKGSFTGAVDKKGLFELANGGTLLLDELNTMPIQLQAKILRVLQEGYIRKVGSEKTINVNVRIIATLNENPHDLIESKRFRRDLFYRLSPIVVEIPPLRERKEDIMMIFEYYLSFYCKKYKIKPPIISKSVLERLTNHPYHGNVRELMNIVENIVLMLGDEKRVCIEHLPTYVCSYTESQINMPFNNYNINEYGNYKNLINEIETKIISIELMKNKWNITNTADSLRMSRQTLQNKIKRFNI